MYVCDCAGTCKFSPLKCEVFVKFPILNDFKICKNFSQNSASQKYKC